MGPGDVIFAGAVLVRTIEPALPWVNATTAILYSRTNNTVIGIKNPDLIRAMASTTKIMTVLIVIERSQLPTDHPDYHALTDIINVSQNAHDIGGSVMNITLGDHLSLHDALYGLLLPSGNDAAVAIAEHFTGFNGGNNGGAFSDIMNTRAAELGLTHTHFQNPHGRDTPGHFSTARDMARLANYALNEPLLAQIVDTSHYNTTTWVDHWGIDKDQMQYNTNRFIKPWNADYWAPVCGVKTGTTTNAGQCLVTRAQYAGEDLIGVVLHSATYHGGPPDRYTDSKRILQYGFDTEYP
jgi:D-alanyl-D-alanine carboxypeptidase (penicillin-binding protein 5/6)